VWVEVTEARSFYTKAWTSKAAPTSGMVPLFLCLRLRGAGRTRRPNDGSRLKLGHLNWMNAKPEFAKTKINDQGLNELFGHQVETDDLEDEQQDAK
jgi:hypothetical protein